MVLMLKNVRAEIRPDYPTPQLFQDKLDPGAFLSNQGTFSVGAAELVRRERQEVGIWATNTDT